MGARFMTRGIFFSVCLNSYNELQHIRALKHNQNENCAAPKMKKKPEIQQFAITLTILKLVKSWANLKGIATYSDSKILNKNKGVRI